jgi:serine/threonine protein kinase
MTVSAWEARVLGKLDDHPNIATVQDYWEDGEKAVMVSRYLPGGTLQDRISQSQESGKGLPVDSILQFSAQITHALAHIHDRRILYRDLQPCNVLFDERGTVHLVDFDTAVSLDDHGISGLQDRSQTCYTAPELAERGSGDERADLYSLGATMYEMACGCPPFAGTRQQVHAARRTSTPPPLDRADLPGALTGMVFRLLAPDPGQRPASAVEVAQCLEDLRAALPGPGTGHRTSPGGQPLPLPDPAEVQASAGAKAPEYAAGDLIDDRFEVLGILGQGGFSKVYHVRDAVEDEDRALKLFDSAAGYAAVRRELGALRKIHHPNVVEVFWADRTSAGDWYLVTEFINGESLHAFTTGQKCLRDREAVDVALDVLAALAAFHPDSARLQQLDARNREGGLSGAEFAQWMELKDQGLVHRDIKPHNVLLTRSGAKLLDFNIASRAGDPVRTLSGTPPYQPPDADLTRWDVSTDLFAVGVTLYQLLCSRHPYPNSMPMAAEPVTEPRTLRPDLNPDLASFLAKACAPARGDRFSTAAEMQGALRNIRVGL